MEAFAKARAHGFSVQSFRKRCVDFHWHFHPEFELTYIERGQGIRCIGRSVRPYASGDLCLMGSHLPHSYGSHPHERTGARWTVLHFLPDRLGQEFWELPQNQPLRSLLQQAGRGIHFTGPDAKTAVSILKKFKTHPAVDWGMLHWLELLFLLARSAGKRFLNPVSSSLEVGSVVDPRLPGVLAWIDERADSPDLTQADAARFLRMSPQSFCRFFRDHLGRSFRDYVNELRVARACSSLLHSDAGISEIAFHAGYNNLANFNRRFRQIMGCVPREYRKRQPMVGTTSD